jgi:hypothetical protein
MRPASSSGHTTDGRAAATLAIRSNTSSSASRREPRGMRSPSALAQLLV